MHPDRLVAARIAAILQNGRRRSETSAAGQAVEIVEQCRKDPDIARNGNDVLLVIAEMAGTLLGKGSVDSVEEAVREAKEIYQDVQNRWSPDIGGNAAGIGWQFQ
jgi:hypothetical protein